MDTKEEQARENEREKNIQKQVQIELKKMKRRRKFTAFLLSAVAVGCLGYYGLYSFYDTRTQNNNRSISALKEKEDPSFLPTVGDGEAVVVHREEGKKDREILDEYKSLLMKNKKLIGWLKIDDTNIDYPVMQTSDNEYYLDHNLNQEYDKNGSIFMDKDCDVLGNNTNYILYGHHMKNGAMFGSLDKYETEKYGKEHAYIQFDTIYEKGLYQVMYVFRDKVYSEEEIAFKYYQFIEANSSWEFDSYMKEMEEKALYDTGVTATYGDRLLTLSTCDYQEKNARFVVVAKKVEKKE